MSIATGIVSAPIKLVKDIGNRYRIAIHENKIDDQIAPEQGVSGFLLDKVEDTANFLTMGLVARVKDGIKTKGYGEMSGEEMDQALTQQYADNVAKSAEKQAEKQQKRWSKLEKQMDKLSVKDQSVETTKQRAANAASLISNIGSAESTAELAL